MNKRLVVVIGMHRGGTSAITRGLQVLGVDLGRNLMPPMPGNNETGFWEDLEIIALNNWLLNSLGHHWHSIAPVAAEGLSDSTAQEFRSRALALLRSRVEAVQVFGIKDPRMPRLLPFWRGIFSELGMPVHYVIVCRNPLSVAVSLERRDSFEPVKSYYLWLQHMFAGLAGTAGCNRIVVDYDCFMDDAPVQLARIAAFLGISGGLDPIALGEFQSVFLNDALRHARFELEDLAVDDRLPAGAAELYSVLQELAADRLGFDHPQLASLLARLQAHQHEMRPGLNFMRALDDRATGLGEMVNARDGQLAELAKNAAERDVEIQLLKQDVARLATQITQLDEELVERDGRIAGLNQVVMERDEQLANLGRTIANQQGRMAELTAVIDDYRRSNSWRVTRPLRFLGGQYRHCRRAANLFSSVLRRGGGFAGTLSKAVRIFGSEGVAGIKHRLLIARAAEADCFDHGELLPASSSVSAQQGRDARYNAWLRVNALTEENAAALRTAFSSRQARLPLISVIMPVFNTPAVLLERAIKSVVDQVYENWELCIADDASSDSRTLDVLRAAARNNPRIKVEFCATNGNISRASNIAAGNARGDFLAFLDHDDELTLDALAEIAIAIADGEDVDYLYSDDDKIDPEGRFFAPQFKPGWSPTLLLSYMYMGHIKVVRRSLFEKIGGFRVGFEGSQDYDFALRMSEQARKVVHVPKVLYHWRVVPGSTAASGDAKPASFEAGRRAVADAFERRGIAGVVEQPKWAADARVGIFTPRFPDSGPRVSIIIPTRNQLDLLRACVESLAKTAYADYDVVIVDNGSDDPKTRAYLDSLQHRVLRIGNRPGAGFSFAHLNNEAVRQVETEFVLFLNNDTKVRTSGWLSQMMGYARMEKVGAVGAKLLFGDNTIQHAGVVHGYADGMVGHAFRNAPAGDHGYLAYTMVAREYSAVTAACLLTPRKLFLESGGFDEEHFAVAYNDVDYCYRLVDGGFRCIYCASAELFHYEGKSRGFSDDPKEVAYLRKRSGGRVDAWYNPNLSLDDEHFRVRPYHAPAHTARPVRAVMATHNLNHEGAPICMFEMAAGLKKLGVIDPVVISPVDGPLRGNYEEAGIAVQIVRHPLADARTVAVFERRLDELAAGFRELGAEVVYGNTMLTFWAIAAGERAGLPTIWNPRESEPWQSYFNFLDPELRKLAYGCFAFPYRIVFVANATRQGWTPLESRFNFTVVHDGLDRDRFTEQLAVIDRDQARARLGIAPDEVVVLLVGTVCERKGQIDLVRALSRASPETIGRLRAFIVGDRPSPYSSQLHKEIKNLPSDAQRRLTVIAETGEVAAYYKAADIALCTSRIESYPRVVLEGMACGLPVIATPVFGIREQVRENINGFFYEPGNTKALAEALSRLVADDALRLGLAGNSRAVLDSLTGFSEMLAGYGKIFREARFSKGLPYQPRGNHKTD